MTSASAWQRVYEKVCETIDDFKGDILFFRGHSNAKWSLVPALGRLKDPKAELREGLSYFDFESRAGDLLGRDRSSWDILFAMQHHGLPTRVLDWTEVFGIALFFALKGAEGDAAVWILDPFVLNTQTTDSTTLPRPDQLGASYSDFFIDESSRLESEAVAVAPLRYSQRVHRQHAGFTLHRDLERPLEDLCPAAVKKIVIPVKAHEDGRQFLRLAGITEFGLFPDLDGLAREVFTDHFAGR